MQSGACFEAMQIDWPVVRQQAIQRGVIMTRVAVRDFDHNDQVDNSLVDFETYKGKQASFCAVQCSP